MKTPMRGWQLLLQRMHLYVNVTATVCTQPLHAIQLPLAMIEAGDTSGEH